MMSSWRWEVRESKDYLSVPLGQEEPAQNLPGRDFKDVPITVLMTIVVVPEVMEVQVVGPGLAETVPESA